jgi:hypothetical protein
MKNIYNSGKYIQNNPSWHVEDSAWKAIHIYNIIKRNNIIPQNIAEIGCGAGMILYELLKKMERHVTFDGYEISPQAFKLTKKVRHERIAFHLEDLLSEENKTYYDLLLVIDVLEHIPDCLNFAEKCRLKAEYKVYHIPLDISVSSVFQNSFIEGRYKHGHLHYFTRESAMAVLKDTGHEIIDYFYTDVGTYYWKKYKTVKNTIENIPRWILEVFSTTLAARIFGRYSLMVLAK